MRTELIGGLLIASAFLSWGFAKLVLPWWGWGNNRAVTISLQLLAIALFAGGISYFVWKDESRL